MTLLRTSASPAHRAALQLRAAPQLHAGIPLRAAICAALLAFSGLALAAETAAPVAAAVGAKAAAATPVAAAAAATNTNAAAAVTPVAFTPIHFDEIGAQVESIALSADGTLIDVRYRVRDAAKAEALLDQKVHPVLIRQADGARFYVPAPPKVGALRQTRRNNKPIEVGRVYFMLFANPGRTVQAGDSISLEIGSKRVDDLKVGR